MTFIKTDLTNYSKISSGSYSGNDTVNRGIPHSLGSAPELVLITANASSWYISIMTDALVNYLSSTVEAQHAVTAVDSTNFYVGNATQYDHSANLTGRTYRWIAIL